MRPKCKIDKPKLALAAASIGVLLTLADPAQAERVRVKLDGAIRGEHAAFYVAREKGYLRAENIEMTVLEEGGPALNTLFVVSQNRFEFGFADLPSLIVARAFEVQVRALAVVNQRSQLALVARGDTSLSNPGDLAGKTIGVEDGTPSYLFYRTLLAAHRIDRAKITEVPTPRPYLSSLLAGKAQVVPAEVGGELSDGTGFKILRAADWGYDVLGGGLFTSVRLLRVNPGLARRFTRAYLRALRDVIDQPKDAIAILVKGVPAVAGQADELLRQLEASIPSFTTVDTVKHGLGWNPPERWQHTHDTLLRAGLVRATAIPIPSLYTNEFIDP
jgi:NitT/TauT family transport system substrate-binding protein